MSDDLGEQSPSSPAESAEGLLHYVREGPYAGGESLLKRSFGFYVWWRTWAMMLGVLVALLALIEFTSFSNEVVIAWGVGILTAWWAEAVSDDRLGVFN